MKTNRELLIEAFRLEGKASKIYDMVFASLSEAQRKNIQGTLIDILYLGNKTEFETANSYYRTDKEKLMKAELELVQCFHRTAMAFSRRKLKATDEAVLNVINDFITKEETTPTNTVSGEDNSKEKKERKQREDKGLSNEQIEKTIHKLIEVVKKDDVKYHLIEALKAMKLTVEQKIEFAVEEEIVSDKWWM